jgi:hypothetical protein
VGVALHRLAKAGKIRRIRRGRYDLPRAHPIMGQTGPNIMGTVRALMEGSHAKWQFTGAYAATAASGTDSFGLVALRRGGVAKAFVAVGTLSVAMLYTAPLVRAMLLQPPTRAHALRPVVAPTLQIPTLRVPAPLKVQASAAGRPGL